MTEKVLVARQLPDKFIQQIEQFSEVDVWNSELEPMPREEFLKRSKDATIVITTLSEKIDETFFESAPKIKGVVNLAVGFDNIDIELAHNKGVVVTNTPEVLTETTAELGFTLMLTAARRIVEAVEYVENGEWKSWGPYLLAGKDVHGSTVGIYGMGAIGEAFARRLKGFNCKVLYHNRSKKEDAEKQLNVEYRTMDQLLEESDFVVCTAPLTPETKGIFNKETFKKMKDSAILINIGRGGHIVESDLIEAIEQKEILGAALDVVENEPISMDHPFLKMDQVIVVPHIGSSSINTRDNMVQLCVDNAKHIIEGNAPVTPVKK
ncbi:D-glycerate dehydrogenase [Mammaliicoccus vitulinus]|uniref:2-hydroxyacid dehydrogenase n=1 Tax=Mammaliicoccus vitulinus TaxID=71237 RepID=UPI00145BD8E0|nr:D-glycerate dehydrogenase [Mammaliicoccus vitulinus]MBM6630045.1 D-glycerate dehydrogenase [Mammaliicoccus vitulinus]MBO3076457.1 D-glycerate dehydrogenase [Mammaliicoccus vitulinus]MEB7657709.1 D-glycerate dehydrogenase [Mammaliicoccus vitulinus]QJF24582.1 D-glycerate dehydrogenase [Mammaliicoccus vitulinus]WQK87347.1 D-glycerate dehydrogenase [Mammaliicoccus vitulinus]